MSGSTASANALVRLGVRPGDRIAFLGYNSHQLLECYYGIPRMGAVLLPLNIRLIAPDFEYICNDSGPNVMFIDPELLDKIEPYRFKDSVSQRLLPSRTRWKTRQAGSPVSTKISLRALLPNPCAPPPTSRSRKTTWRNCSTRAALQVPPRESY